VTFDRNRRRVAALALLFALLLACGAGLVSRLPLTLSEGGEEEEFEEKPLAAEWFREQRAYPLAEIPYAAYARAVEQLEREEERLRATRLEAVAEVDALRWEPLGPQPISNGNVAGARPVSGRVTALALDPRYDGVSNQTVYLGAAQGGVWRSPDNGATWAPITEDAPSQAVGSIAVDPANPNVIYVGTGEGNSSGDSYYGAGLLKSTDGGASWAHITGPISTAAPRAPAFLNAAITRVAVDPRNSAVIYVCTKNASTYGPSGGGPSPQIGQRGVWKSTDGGATWRNLDPTSNGGLANANGLVIDPRNSNRIFAAMPGAGVYRSTAGGESGTWERLTNGLPTSDVGRIALATGPPLAPSAETTIYAAVANGGGTALRGVYRSTDNGASWSQQGVPGASQVWYNLSLAVDPADANVVYFGEVNLHRSTDGGATWSNQTGGNGTGGLHVDHHAIAVSPANRNVVFVGNDGGAWRTDAASASVIGWTNLNQTLNTVQFQSIALHPTDSNFLLGGTQDNGSNRFTGDVAWRRVAGGDGGFALVDQSNPSLVYHTFQNNGASDTRSASFGPRFSADGGNTWLDRGCRSCSAAQGRMNPNDRVGFYAPLAGHPGFTQSPGNVIYFGTHRLYRSADNGATWTGVGPSADGYGQDLSKGGRLSVIAAFPKLDVSANPPGEVVWVGTSDGNVQVTTNAGALSAAIFKNVTRAPLPNRFVTDIAPDLTDARRAYVTFSGFDASTPSAPGHVFMTTDGGETWRDISGNLPDVPVTSIAVDPQQAGTLYIGTDLGVFQTADGGATWLRLGEGMPRVATFMVRYHAATRSLVAATHGRGVYRLSLALPVTSASAASYSRAALAVEGIASAFGPSLAAGTGAAAAIPLPTSLAGTSVRVRDLSGVERLAPLFYVSPTQINYQIPPGTLPGPVAVTVTGGDGSTSAGSEDVALVAPSLFTANATGSGAPAAFAVRARAGQQTVIPVARLDALANPPQYVPAEIDLGPAGDVVALVLYGTGVRKRTSLAAVRVVIGGVEVQPEYAGEAPGYVGLDQINVIVPRSLAGRGEVDLVLRAEGVATNTVRVRIK
jgi:uncharacterized protein (TIGR03437 family)